MKLTCESELASRAVNMLAPNEVIKLTTNEVREAIVQKIPEFNEIISQTGRGGQSDFISLIQK